MRGWTVLGLTLLAWAVSVLIVVLASMLGGCGSVYVESVRSADGSSSLTARGFSVMKDHGLERLTYKKDGTEFGAEGYTSQSRLELLAELLKLLQGVK